MPPTHPQEACGLPESAMAPHTPAPLAPHPNHLLNSPSTMPLLAHTSLLPHPYCPRVGLHSLSRLLKETLIYSACKQSASTLQHRAISGTQKNPLFDNIIPM